MRFESGQDRRATPLRFAHTAKSTVYAPPALDLSVVCDQPAQANAFAQLLTLWRDSQKAGSSSTSTDAMYAFISGMQISADGNRVEVSGSGPANLVSLFFSGGLAR